MTPTPRSRSAKRSKKAAVEPKRPFVAHHLVPPHELLSEEEGQRVLAQLKTPAERLPKILLQDPGLNTDPGFVRAKESGEKLVGRVVRIRRPSETAGLSIAYRVLIPSSGSS
ncbi:MAG: DNA-directed RNA polymerase subunit RpoH/Rpb5 C-terminal domain-containing protein [Thermoplasmata archaeon]